MSFTRTVPAAVRLDCHNSGANPVDLTDAGIVQALQGAS